MTISQDLMVAKRLVSDFYFSLFQPWIGLLNPFSLWLRANWTGVGLQLKKSDAGWVDELVLTLYFASPPPFGAHLAAALPPPLPDLHFHTEVTGRLRPLNGKVRPASAGVSIGTMFHDLNTACTQGTLGAVVKDEKGRRHILSNNHILALNGEVLGTSGNPFIVQPSVLEDHVSMNANKIAQVESNIVPLLPLPSRNKGDVALARILDGSAVLPTTPLGMPPIRSANPIAPEAMVKVLKFGSRTGLTHGLITNPSFDHSLAYSGMGTFLFVDQFLVQPDGPSQVFSDEGDSGSLVITEAGDPIGVVFARDDLNTVVTPLFGPFTDRHLCFVLPGE